MFEDAHHTVHLPQEILLKIFSSLKSDRCTLKSCSLVDKAWNQAIRTHLFHSIDLSAILGRNDWLSFFINAPFDVGDLVRQVIVKDTSWDHSFASTSTLVLSHFATSLSSLTLSNLSIADFADLASTISKFKQLRTLSLKHVCWETNSVDLDEPILPRHTFPATVTTLHLFHLDLGELFGWLLAHTQPLTPTKVYIGPVEYQWKRFICSFFVRYISSITELGFLLPDSSTALEPYSLCSSEAWMEGAFGAKASLSPELYKITERFQARHGFSIHSTQRGVIGPGCRILRVHQFLFHLGDNRARTSPTVLFARVFLTLEGFRGSLLLDVDVPNTRAMSALNIDWEFIDDVLSAETHKDIKAVVFVAVTDIRLSALESFISEKLAKSYGRGLLRFERGENMCT